MLRDLKKISNALQPDAWENIMIKHHDLLKSRKRIPEVQKMFYIEGSQLGSQMNAIVRKGLFLKP